MALFPKEGGEQVGKGRVKGLYEVYEVYGPLLFFSEES